jgi:hypothetical protein
MGDMPGVAITRIVIEIGILIRAASLSRKWVVERFFAWIERNGRLAKDFEATIASARAFLYAASIMPISRRIARQYEFETDSKKEPRRSGANNKRGQVQRGMQRGQHLTRSG